MYRPEQILKGMQNVYKNWFGISIPAFMLRPQQMMKKDAIIEGALAKDFVSGERQLRPVIFSHGLFANNISYTGLQRDLASHGYLVIAINHADGTCIYTQNSQGQAVPHGRFEYTLKDYRRRQVEQRVDEILSVVTDLTEMLPLTHN